MYSTENVRKSVIAGRFPRTLKNKIYENMKILGKNMCLDILGDVVLDYNGTAIYIYNHIAQQK